MKHLFSLFLICALGLTACSVEFNPPAIVTNPPPAPATRTPVILMATPTFTALPTTVPATIAPTEPQGTNTLAPLPSATLPADTPAAPTRTAPVPAPTLSMEQLRGVTVTVLGNDNASHTITLKDGVFEQGTDRSKPGYISVKMSDIAAFGDLNGDGQSDAAIILAENFGGSGTYVIVYAILNQGGQPQAAASALIDDRALVHTLSIQDGQILVDATIHGPNDPMCCPGLPSKGIYRLSENNLVLTQFSTTTANGVDRVIQVDSPANGTEINSPFVINGSVTVSPFENTLRYIVFVQGKRDPVLQAGFTIKGDGLGGPGSFELPIDPAKINFKGPVRIEISDINAADGSYLAVNTLFVVLK